MNSLKTTMLCAWITVGLVSFDAVIAGTQALAADPETTTASTVEDSTQGETISPLAGHWRAAETDDEKEQRLGAIERVTEDMGRFKRGKARGRLADRTSPPPRLTIDFEGSQVTIITGGQELVLELGAAPVEISDRDESTRVSAEMVGERLVVVADSEDGARTSTYSAEGDHLSKEVVLNSNRLADELTFTTTYKRVD
jgi:hypothetical protein